MGIASLPETCLLFTFFWQLEGGSKFLLGLDLSSAQNNPHAKRHFRVAGLLLCSVEACGEVLWHESEAGGTGTGGACTWRGGVFQKDLTGDIWTEFQRV